MKSLAHNAAVRLAAILAAVGLSGLTPWLEHPHAEPIHRCQCAKGGGHHDCDCPLCAAEAARAARLAQPASQGAKVPPCHLARDQKAQAEEREAAARRARGPALSSSCGDGDHRFDPPPSVPSFTIPEAPALAVHVAVVVLDDRLAAALGVPVEPETPPPRPA